MSILTRYILKKFLRPFVASYAALSILIMVSQLFDRLDRFLAEGTKWSHVVLYLISSLPYQAMQILPVACLLATLFVVGNLVRTREYIAGLAGGLPPERFLAGLLWAGLSISLLALFLNETLIPVSARYSKELFRDKIRRLGEWQQTTFEDVFVAGSEGRIWSAVRFDQEKGHMERVVIDTFVEGRLGMQVDASSAQWTADGWVFSNGVIRRYKSDNLSVDFIDPFSVKTLAFKERPDDLVTQEPEPAEMNYKTLKRHVKRLSSLGVPIRQLEVELMMKLAFPFSCFIVILLGIPLSMSGRGSRGKGIAVGGALTLVYMGFIQFGKALAQRMIPPWTGAWLGNFVFISVALYLWWKLRRAT